MKQRGIQKKRYHEEQTGAGLIEYALLVALISVLSISAIDVLGDSISNSYANITENFEEATALHDEPGGGGGNF